mmetsp:Transcript_49822/g.108317  ORF Transcript_49822/g.108317 Transcript_49822/m.108317 type:complete len:380 (+) Transcript_49822:601-1740(+)
MHPSDLHFLVLSVLISLEDAGVGGALACQQGEVYLHLGCGVMVQTSHLLAHGPQSLPKSVHLRVQLLGRVRHDFDTVIQADVALLLNLRQLRELDACVVLLQGFPESLGVTQQLLLGDLPVLKVVKDGFQSSHPVVELELIFARQVQRRALRTVHQRERKMFQHRQPVVQENGRRLTEPDLRHLIEYHHGIFLTLCTRVPHESLPVVAELELPQVRKAIVRVLEQVGASPHSLYGLLCFHVQKRLNVNLESPPPVSYNVFQVVPLLGWLYDVCLPVLQHVELLIFEDLAILLGLGLRLILACELNLAQDETSIYYGVAGAKHRLPDVSWPHVCVPTNYILLTLVVNVDEFLLDVLHGQVVELVLDRYVAVIPCSAAEAK